MHHAYNQLFIFYVSKERPLKNKKTSSEQQFCKQKCTVDERGQKEMARRSRQEGNSHWNNPSFKKKHMLKL